MLFREMTKAQRRHLRELAATAHERELSVELGKLETDFARWRSGEIDAHQLSESIHAFHQGPSRKLYTRYTDTDPDFSVAAAVVRGILSESDVGAEMLELLARHLSFLRERESR